MIYVSAYLVIANTVWIEYQALTWIGLFSFSFQSAEDLPVNLNDMSAYNLGEKLRVSTSWVITLHHTINNTDSKKIRLKVKDCYRMPDWNEITLYDNLFISFPKSYGCLERTWEGLDTWATKK